MGGGDVECCGGVGGQKGVGRGGEGEDEKRGEEEGEEEEKMH